MPLTRSISRWTRSSAGRFILPLLAAVMAIAFIDAPATAAHGRRSAPRVSYCDVDGCSIRGRHDHHSHHRLTDFDRGFRLGDRDGRNDGFTDGRYGRAFCGTPGRDLSCYSCEFVEGYRAAYRRAYRDAYREGARLCHRGHRHHRHHRRW